jgi:hypothetical protein
LKEPDEKIPRKKINHYVEQKSHSKKGKKKLIAGYKWKPVTLNNVMMYFGIPMYAMLNPVNGHFMHEAWDSPNQNAWTKFMSKGRYLQICSMLHFNDNSGDQKLETVSLHKIRPLGSRSDQNFWSRSTTLQTNTHMSTYVHTYVPVQPPPPH